MQHGKKLVKLFITTFLVNYSVFQKSDAKIEITMPQILSELNILLAALIITFLVQIFQISTKSTAQFWSNSCLKMELKNRSFQYGKVALAVRTQYHQLQFVFKVVAIFTDICMSLVQTVRSLLLPDFLSTDPVASVCRRSRSSAEQTSPCQEIPLTTLWHCNCNSALKL